MTRAGLESVSNVASTLMRLDSCAATTCPDCDGTVNMALDDASDVSILNENISHDHTHHTSHHTPYMYMYMYVENCSVC